MVKSIFLSKTAWFNAAAFALQVLTYFTGVVPVEFQPVLAGIVAAINLYLRYITKDPVSVP